MATLIVMCRDLAQRLYRESHWPVTGTATGGDSVSLIDATALVYTFGDANSFDRKWVYRETSPSDAITSVRVDEGGLAGGGGDLTLSPSLTTAFANGNLYIITDHHIDVLKNAINRVLRNIFLPTFFPLSMHVMGNDANDMEPSTIATDYTSEGTSTLATESTIVFNGAQSLKTTASAANSGASTGNISVYDGKPYYAAVMCSVQQGDAADFSARNVQNSDTQIDDNATTDEPSWTELVIPFTPPTDCEQVDIFMLGVGSNDVIYWDDFQVWFSGDGVYPLPSWITRPEQMLDVRSFPRGTAGPAADFDWRADEKRSIKADWGFERVDRRADAELRLWVNDVGSSRPFIYALRPLDTLSSDSTNTVAEQDFVVRWAEMLILEPENASTLMARLRGRYFQRVTTTLPTRIASGSGIGHHPHRHHYRHH